jgi:oleandomycin transport system ATP-binding protein
VSGAEPEAGGRGRLTVQVDSEAALGQTVNALAQEQISVTELSLHLPSLDEVFFSLTGRPTDTTNQEEAA